MAICDMCGSENPRAMTITIGGDAQSGGVFDSFECAIAALAPHCGHCRCRILGHGLESGNDIFCCAHCAREAGHRGLIDHIGPADGGSGRWRVFDDRHAESVD
ncbi:hypothetical protein [Gordonia polyisoprenivorans]|uniref:hypothetical protein n=1 Tax=Gordonia polyisoprenivorans TaxID=84595 RepID=UPI0030CE00D2